MKLCFMGFGEAASEMARGLRADGLNEIYAYDVMQNDERFGPAVHERIEKTGVTLVSSVKELAEIADFVFTIVPPNCTMDALKSILPHLKKGTYYTDLTASTPDAKREMARVAEEGGVVFTDGAMLGALLVYQNKVPILASGKGAVVVREAMTPYGMNITEVGEQPGDASAVKLIRSIYMKGTASLVIETLQAAEHFGVSDLVIPSLAETFDSKTFVETMSRLATGTSIHASRRGAELSGSLAMLRDAGLDASMTEAAYAKHMMVAKANIREKLGGKPPKSWQETISLLGGTQE